MGKDDTKGANAADVDVYFNQIRQIIKQYRSLNERLSKMNKKKHALQIPDLLLERTTLKDNWISKKQAARANITLLKGGLDVLKDRELRDLQEEYREVNEEFRNLGFMAEKESLFDGAEKRAKKGGDFDPSRAKNDDLLDKAQSVQRSNLDKLKQGLSVVEATKEQGKFTAAQLEQDREKLKRIDSGLDEVQGELELSRVLITRVLKNLATDKIVIAFAFLLVAGIVGIVCYATLYKGQTTFIVPDIVTVPCTGSTSISDASSCLYGTKSITVAITPSPAVSARLLRGA